MDARPLLFVLLAIVGTAGAREAIVIENEDVEVRADLRGGSIAEFQFRSQGLNPLTGLAPSGETVCGFGHFICLDRWGPGTKPFPFHGEASHVIWTTIQTPRKNGDAIEAVMQASLPLANLSVRRNLQLAPARSVLDVREEITNHNENSRPFNMVQHPTIAHPFLDATTRVDCNGTGGLDQDHPEAAADQPAFFWPTAKNADGRAVDLRHLEDDASPAVTTFRIQDDFGWITAATPAQGLLIGYVWRASDFPWVSHWRDAAHGAPAMRGLEFGTAGRHAPMETLLAQKTLWGFPLFEELAAGATAKKHYQAFLLRIPADFHGTSRVSVEKDRLVIHEDGAAAARQWTLSTSGLPQL
jgi:hypothetical protein